MLNLLGNLIIIGDRVLIKPKEKSSKTKSGLYLPPGVKEKEKIQSGYVVKVGPGYPIPSDETNEVWKNDADTARFIPLQAQAGDLAIFLLNAANEIEYKSQKYFIVPQSAILMLERDETLFD